MTATTCRVLLLTEGLPDRYDPGFGSSIIASIPGVSCTEPGLPSRDILADADLVSRHDVIAFYDTPGWERLPSTDFGHAEPPADLMAWMDRLTQLGKGLLFLHKALAAWPASSAYGEVMGGHWFVGPGGTIRGHTYPESGYLYTTHTVALVEPGHPVVQGVPEQFDIYDELFLCPVLEDEVQPLLRSGQRFEDAFFSSPVDNLRGVQESSWRHPATSDVIGWAKAEDASPIVCLLLGCDPAVRSSAHYRRLVRNSVLWLASPEAKHWARQRQRQRV